MNRNIVLLALSLIAITSVVDAGSYITNATQSFTVVPIGSIPVKDMCILSDGKAFPGDEVTIYYTVQNVGNVDLENVKLVSSLNGNVPLRADNLIPFQSTTASMVTIAPNKYGNVIDNVTLTATYPDEPGAWPKAKIIMSTMREIPFPYIDLNKN